MRKGFFKAIAWKNVYIFLSGYCAIERKTNKKKFELKRVDF
jgi:hypothetical protein